MRLGLFFPLFLLSTFNPWLLMGDGLFDGPLAPLLIVTGVSGRHFDSLMGKDCWMTSNEHLCFYLFLPECYARLSWTGAHSSVFRPIRWPSGFDFEGLNLEANFGTEERREYSVASEFFKKPGILALSWVVQYLSDTRNVFNYWGHLKPFKFFQASQMKL